MISTYFKFIFLTFSEIKWKVDGNQMAVVEVAVWRLYKRFNVNQNFTELCSKPIRGEYSKKLRILFWQEDKQI